MCLKTLEQPIPTPGILNTLAMQVHFGPPLTVLCTEQPAGAFRHANLFVSPCCIELFDTFPLLLG